MEQGDIMKLKRWHLYLIVTLFFTIAFISINRKYDRFYRVNGINNDNRALIEMYLDDEEQDYLVENAIAVDQFIKYIEFPEFKLQYYEFYNALNRTNKYSNYSDLINVGNQLASKLEVSFASNALSRCNTLIKNDLVNAYINQEGFSFDNIDYYQLLRSLYDEGDYTYIADTNTYLSIMKEFDGLEGKKLYDNVKLLSNNFTKGSLASLFNHDLQPNAKRIYNPSDLALVVNNETYIGGYEPKNQVEIRGIPRVKYSMYLQEDANNSLMEMYRALNDEGYNDMVLTAAYISYDVASLGSSGILPGYNEYQLGTTINLQKREISIADFDQTDIYKWLINHCHEYGFILRYPSDKVDVTNHEYSSTTFRYVGKEIASKLHVQNLALEEYNANEE